MKAAVILLAFAPIVAISQSWSYLAQGLLSDGGSYDVYLDASSLRQQGPHMKGWLLSAYKTYQVDHYNGGIQYKGATSLVYANCRDRTLATKQFAYYADPTDLKTMQRTATVPDTALVFDDPLPGSVANTILDRMCAKR